MKKFYVSRNTKFVPEYELSISNRIVTEERFSVLSDILKRWVRMINPDFDITCTKPEMDGFHLHGPKNIGLKLNIVHTPSNVRVQLGKYENLYDILESLN